MDMTVVSHRYACAFIQRYGWYNHDIAWMEQLCRIADFLQNNRHYFFYKPQEGYRSLFGAVHLPDRERDAIVALLERHNRLMLLPDILYEVVALYKTWHNIECCVVQSACVLTAEQKMSLKNILENKIGTTLRCAYELDSSLIAGIRVLGENFVYEDSVAHTLQMLEQAYTRSS